ncbi:MAG: NUDIX hydrolase [Reichenbachiella sp.]
MSSEPSKTVVFHTESYKDAKPLLVAVDNVIFGFDASKNKLKVLLFKRQVAPEAGNWSLIGSFVKSDESAMQAAQRILNKFTGLKDVFLEQFRTYAEVNRDPGARVLSIGHYSLIRIDDQNDELVKTFDAKWFDLNKIPELVIDHRSIVNDALVLLQEDGRRKPIGFNLLPKKFTIPQLFQLYQEIYRKPLDDRNFRKKILATDLLIKLEEKDKSGSKKGAFLFQFDENKYKELQTKGFDIQFH